MIQDCYLIIIHPVFIILVIMFAFDTWNCGFKPERRLLSLRCGCDWPGVHREA